jgi:hypothetical protein
MNNTESEVMKLIAAMSNKEASIIMPGNFMAQMEHGAHLPHACAIFLYCIIITYMYVYIS